MHLKTATTIAAMLAAASAATVTITASNSPGGNIIEMSPPLTVAVGQIAYIWTPVNVCGSNLILTGTATITTADTPIFENSCKNDKAKRVASRLVVSASITTLGNIRLSAPEGVQFDICGREFGPGKVQHAEQVQCKKGDQIYLW